MFDKKITIEHIIAIKKKHKINLVDAVVMYCEECNIDIDDFSSDLKKETEFIELLKQDAMEANYLRESDGFFRRPSLKTFF